MAKISGLGATIIVQDAGSVARTISNDITNYTFTTPRATQETTGVDKSAIERLLLLADYTVNLNGVLNTAANMSHAVFATIPSTSVTRSVSIAPTSNGSTPILAVNCLLTDYQITRANTGELTWQVPGSLADGSVPTWA
jgi:hypothetical protein